jgi:hypothetical protein
VRRKCIRHQPALDERNVNVEDRFLMVLFAGFREVCGLVCEDVELVLTSTYACLNHSFDWGEQAVSPSDVWGSSSILYYICTYISISLDPLWMVLAKEAQLTSSRLR